MASGNNPIASRYTPVIKALYGRRSPLAERAETIKSACK